MATVKDVALRAGVSLGSVSNYLNGKRLKPKTASRIKKPWMNSIIIKILLQVG